MKREDESGNPAAVRAWVDRHGANVTAAARRLAITRTHLQALLADPRAASRAVPIRRSTWRHMLDVARLVQLGDDDPARW